MSNSIVAGIVVKSEFCVSQSNVFSNYIEYIDRDEAQRNEHFADFSLYNDYMGNPEKTTALFTKDNDSLSDMQKVELKKLFQKAQNNGSLMWQNVISFDNKWLEKYGAYNPLTGDLDLAKIQSATRLAMDRMAINEKMQSTLVWSAAVHYNTDNIHIHIAGIETTPTREIIKSGAYAGQQRGKLQQKTLDNFRTSVYQTMLDRSASYTDVTNIIRNIIVGDKKHGYNSGKEMKRLYNEIYSQLPKKQSSWKYNNASVVRLQPQLNALTDMFIQKYHRNEYAELLQKLDAEERLQREAFGNTYREGDYKRNKLNDMYTRMGNSILNSMKGVKSEATSDFNSKSNNYKYRPTNISNADIARMRKLLRKDWDSIVNQRAFEELQQSIEMGSDNYG